MQRIFSAWLEHISRVQGASLEPLPPKKVFNPIHSLPVLESYHGVAPVGYWDMFP